MAIMHAETRGEQDRTPAQAEAFKRMALFPSQAEILYVKDDLCVVRTVPAIHLLHMCSDRMPR